VADTRTYRVWVQTVGKAAPLECPKPDTFNRQLSVGFSGTRSALGDGIRGVAVARGNADTPVQEQPATSGRSPSFGIRPNLSRLEMVDVGAS
jgi:hypothetical protein